MRIGEALEGIGECRYTAAKHPTVGEMMSEAIDIEKHIKMELGYKLGDLIARSDKIVLERGVVDQRYGSAPVEYRAELFILTREEMQQLIINVEINTRREQSIQFSPRLQYKHNYMEFDLATVGKGIMSGKGAANAVDDMVQKMLEFAGINTNGTNMMNIVELQVHMKEHDYEFTRWSEGNHTFYKLTQRGKDILLGELWHEHDINGPNMTSKFMNKLTPIT